VTAKQKKFWAARVVSTLPPSASHEVSETYSEIPSSASPFASSVIAASSSPDAFSSVLCFDAFQFFFGFQFFLGQLFLFSLFLLCEFVFFLFFFLFLCNLIVVANLGDHPSRASSDKQTEDYATDDDLLSFRQAFDAFFRSQSSAADEARATMGASVIERFRLGRAVRTDPNRRLIGGRVS
jgi:hypothetical protein